MKFLESFFQLKEHGTTVRTEVLAGCTTFLTMAYIIFVNPLILSQAGMNSGSVFVATCLVTIIACLLMGLCANYPIAVAPGMALNVYFTYVVVDALGFTWQHALGASLLAGILFLIIAITPIRRWIIAAIPSSLNTAITAGLGLFIGLIALKSAGIIVPNVKTIVSLGHMNLNVLFMFIGFIIIISCDYYRIPGAILIGIIAITLLGLACGLTHFHGFISLPPHISPTLFQFQWHGLFNVHGFAVIFALLFVTLFDCTGTLIGLLHHDAQLDKTMLTTKRISRGLFADSIASIAGGLLGTSNTSPYAESATGIRAGGRTGLTPVVIAILFVIALFLAPLAATIPSFATAPALLYVACMMLRSIAALEWQDFTESIPAVLTVIMIPFSLSIANGVGIGIISYTILKLIARRHRQLNLTLVILAILFVVYFILQSRL